MKIGVRELFTHGEGDGSLLVGMENKFRFWEDAWVEGECLANKFPRLYLLSEQKKKVISEMGFLSLALIRT